MKRSPELELGDPAHSADPQRGAAGHAAELMREERGIGCDHDDDGARSSCGLARLLPGSARRRGPSPSSGSLVAVPRLGDLLPHRHSGDAEQSPLAEVALDQHADGVPATPGR